MTATTGSQQRAAGPFGWRTVTPLVMGSALNPVNSSVIATALVPIAAALHVPVGRTLILVSSLYLACAIAQPTAGKLAEEFGPRRVFLAGIMLVLLGGVVGGLGDNLAVLVAARVLIGVGTSCGYPSAMVIIRRRSHQAGLGEPPGSVLGSLAIAGSATVAIGPPIGGLLVGGLGWRSAFLLNVPLTAAALAMTLAWIPRDEQPAAGRKIAEVATRIDLGGIVVFGAMLAALLVFLMSLPRPDWAALAISAVLAALLAAWELRAARPFIDLRLLASARALTRTYLRFGLTLLGVYVVLYGITQWMEAARGLSPEQAGLVLVPMGAVAAVVSHPVSRRNLVRGPLIACALFMLLASAATLFITGHSAVIALVGVMVLFGVVVGTASVGNQTALYLQSPPENLGTASGLSRTFGYLGSIAAATITSIVFRAHVSDAGLHDMALILVGVAAAVLLMTLLDRQLPRRPKGLGLSSATPPSPDTKGSPVPAQSPAIDPRRAALVIMDYQPAVLGGLDDHDQLLTRAAGAIDLARHAGITVAYVRIAFADEDYEQVPEANKMLARVARSRALHHEAPETQIHGRLEPQLGDIVVRKTRVGAFSTTDLDQQLEDRGITTLILAGVSTSGVVLSTVREAADRDYRIYVLADASADRDPHVHAVLTEKVLPMQAHLITVADLPGLIITAARPSAATNTTTKVRP